ncbi:DUF5050 domain-containing protein [Paenibacillus polysaccharolyticus]|uniref:DUF5050 domain-containing protein n=1 Tax=Paenibacillus polysaccharolyticus TaxID=582692 RepID=UPI0020A18624|nr:DUF5050 domain-containing protein [Paenibacillus polysaccharolyticus]MCP1135440.1 DUF5050 domain-containing protein [Paenibacillus polysaccharolyticus]
MKTGYTYVQRTLCALLLFTLITAVTLAGGTAAQAASLSQSTVYYESDGVLYKVSGDGSNPAEVLIDFEGVDLTAAGSYLYYTKSSTSTTLLRVPNDGSSDEPETFASDVINYYADNGFIYYIDSKGSIYRANGDQGISSATKIADKVNTDYPLLIVTKGRVYYNALVGGNTWVASKASNGTGNVQNLAQGAVESRYFVNFAKNELQLMVNTNPDEQYYSTKAIVMYKANYNTGKGTAVNAKAKLDVNAVYSGGWSNNLYVYNSGIKLDSNKEYNYTLGKAYALTTSGKTFQLHSKSVREVSAVGTDKVVIIDADQKAYAKTVTASKVSKTSNLNLSNVTYVTNQWMNDKPDVAYISGKNGLYAVNPSLKVSKIAADEWETFHLRDDVPGIFYIHAKDEFRLYHSESNGTGQQALSDIFLDNILLITLN